MFHQHHLENFKIWTSCVQEIQTTTQSSVESIISNLFYSTWCMQRKVMTTRIETSEEATLKSSRANFDSACCSPKLNVLKIKRYFGEICRYPDVVLMSGPACSQFRYLNVAKHLNIEMLDQASTVESSKLDVTIVIF